VQHAESVHADLIVLGTRGRASIRDLLLGSTAERALAESRCSVLAVKPMADA
jgi:universal stress protein E